VRAEGRGAGAAGLEGRRGQGAQHCRRGEVARAGEEARGRLCRSGVLGVSREAALGITARASRGGGTNGLLCVRPSAVGKL
jgi:hypothetical protein